MEVAPAGATSPHGYLSVTFCTGAEGSQFEMRGQAKGTVSVMVASRSLIFVCFVNFAGG